MPVEEILEASYQAQVNAAPNDAMGLCVFGGRVPNQHEGLVGERLSATPGQTQTPHFRPSLKTSLR
ncbi:hypothetical protein [Thermus scotoductus]|uniref:hypothetical protein n=1 Tax=Thermus scotoductus TaxID=37636 RepID=UPI001562E64B|nr:hypothetical protein [Thermus scotoductus]